MGLYELMVLVPPDLEEPSKDQITKFLQETITSAGGSIVSDKDFGKKELAYPISKHSSAHYLYFEAEIPPGSIAAVDKKFRINESVMRHLLVKKEPAKKRAKKEKKSVSEKKATEEAKTAKSSGRGKRREKIRIKSKK